MSNTEFGQSYATKLGAYAAFNGFVLFVICVNLLLLSILFYYPFTIGVYTVLPYYTYMMIYNRAGAVNEGCRWCFFSEKFFIFRIGRDYLQLNSQLSRELQQAEKEAEAQFIFAFFPHGTAADYRVLLDGIWHEAFPNISVKIKTLAASVLFRIPVVREICLWTGCVDASRAVAERVLSKGYSIVVLPGGEAEQIRTVYQEERVFVKNRKGFVKLAMRTNVPIVPVYVFGTSDYYYTNQAFFDPREWLQKRLGICIPLATGLWGSLLCPLPVKTTIVYGDPLSFKLKKNGSPTNEELDAGHEKFCKALLHLFDSHKHELGYGERTLKMN